MRLGSLFLAVLLLAACAAVPTSEARRQRADAAARQQGWRALRIPAGGFELLAYVPRQTIADASLTVYIEGDGLAWLTPSQPSADPTPHEPLGLLLALKHPAGNAAYLGRPCQYLGETGAARCGRRYWIERRFAPEVIVASDAAVDLLMEHFGARRLTLVGYSGGAAVAALLAARRADVERLVTVAGNLDHTAWSAHHRLDILAGSLNPADYRQALSRIPQRHFAGAEDEVMPPALIQSFVAGFPESHRPEVRVVPGYDHRCCWQAAWPALAREAGL